MLNEVRARHIRKLVIEAVSVSRTAKEVVDFEVARREDTVRGLESQSRREHEEIALLKSLDVKELAEEKEGGKKKNA